MDEVTAIDTSLQTVFSLNQSYRFDYLVIATGANYNYFGNDQWQEFAPSLKSLIDATNIRQQILLAFEMAEMEMDQEKRKQLLTFVIIGAGPTGVELAGAISELSHRALNNQFRNIDPDEAEIVLLDAGPRVLSSFSEKISEQATEELTRKRITVRLNAAVQGVDASGVIVGGERIYSSTVIWAAGVVGSDAKNWLDAECDRQNRVVVNPDLSVPGHEDIFVIGDTACTIQDGKGLPGVAQVAIQGGKYVGNLIKRRLHGDFSSPEFRYFDKGNMATIGRKFGVVERGKIQFAGLFAWLAWVFIHVWYLIGFRNKMIVLIEWMWSYITFQRGSRLILSKRLLDGVTKTEFNSIDDAYIRGPIK